MTHGNVFPFPRHPGHEPWVDKRTLAAELCMSERWIELRMKDGLPSQKWGRSRRFRISEVVEWLKERAA